MHKKNPLMILWDQFHDLQKLIFWFSPPGTGPLEYCSDVQLENNPDNFKSLLEETLSKISYSHDCSDVNRASEIHRNHLEDFTITLLSEMETVAKQTLP